MINEITRVHMVRLLTGRTITIGDTKLKLAKINPSMVQAIVGMATETTAAGHLKKGDCFIQVGMFLRVVKVTEKPHDRVEVIGNNVTPRKDKGAIKRHIMLFGSDTKFKKLRKN